MRNIFKREIPLAEKRKALVNQKRDELDDQLFIDGWRYLTHGAFNLVYKNERKNLELIKDHPYKGPWVLKFGFMPSDNPDFEMDTVERSIKIMKQINPELPVGGCLGGWFMPYLDDQQVPSDREVAEAILDIYRRTKRVPVDAVNKGNFMRNRDGKVILVDVGAAVRRDSAASARYMARTASKLEPFWDDFQDDKPITVSVIKTLLYLEKYLPIDADQLFGEINLEIIMMLNMAREEDTSISIVTLQSLVILNHLNLMDQVDQQVFFNDRGLQDNICVIYHNGQLDTNQFHQLQSDVQKKFQFEANVASEKQTMVGGYFSLFKSKNEVAVIDKVISAFYAQFKDSFQYDKLSYTRSFFGSANLEKIDTFSLKDTINNWQYQALYNSATKMLTLTAYSLVSSESDTIYHNYVGGADTGKLFEIVQDEIIGFIEKNRTSQMISKFGK